MPELPEVETVRTVLAPTLLKRKVVQVVISDLKVLGNGTPAQFTYGILQKTITKMTRRGKYLTVHFNNGNRVVIHLRMTGVLTVNHPQDPVARHTVMLWVLDNGDQMRFADDRGFGRFWLIHDGQPDISGQQKLGVEPDKVTAEYLQQKFARRSLAVKSLLLDQAIVAGIGNIYSDEICFRTGILPTRAGNSLTPDEYSRLADNIKTTIAEFINNHHVTLTEYRKSEGKSYQTDKYLQVYGHADDPCPNCGTKLCGTRINGRSSVYCPRCQK